MASFHKQVAPFLFGAGEIAHLCDQLKLLGATKALICTDKGVISAGVCDKATGSLSAHKFPFVVFDGCEPDAPETSFFPAADLARSEGCDAVVAVGGGSDMDTAKVASTLIKSRATLDELMAPGPARTPEVILILVPTTCGTGSEETAVGVASRSSDHLKFGVRITGASLSIIDPELTLGLPPSLTAQTGMDVVAHAIEAFTTVPAAGPFPPNAFKNPYSDQLALAAMSLAAKWLPVAVKDGKNIEARTNMALACMFGGMSFNDSMNNFGHGVAHAFGTYKRMAHGLCCALAEPATIQAAAPVIPELVKEIGLRFGAVIPDGAAPEEIGKATGDALRKLMKEIGIPSLESLNFTREEILDMKDAVLAEFQTRLAPIAVTGEIATQVLASMYDDYK